MELRHFEQIIAIYRHRSISGAARQLKIAQPTLSRSLSHLESKLGVKLFQRSNGGMEPTPFADLIAERASTIIEQAENIQQELKQLARRETGSLTLGVGPVIRFKILPPLIESAIEHMPGINLGTQQGTGRGVVRDLKQGLIDAALVHYEYALEHPDLIRVHVLSDEVVLAVKPDHPVLNMLPITPDKLVQLPLATSNLPPSLERALGRIDSSPFDKQRGFISDDFDSIRRRTIDSGFVAIVPRFLFSEDFDTGRLVPVPLSWADPYECWMLATPRSWQWPSVKKLAELAKRVGSGMKIPLTADPYSSQL